MESYVTITSDRHSARALQTLLDPELLDSDARLEVTSLRSLESAVLIAIVGSVGTGFGALVAGLLKVAAQKEAHKITLRGRTGRSIEIPVGTPPETVAQYIRLAKELDVDTIEL